MASKVKRRDALEFFDKLWIPRSEFEGTIKTIKDLKPYASPQARKGWQKAIYSIQKAQKQNLPSVEIRTL